ncbi:hypothetical protein LA080_013654 [Diaporthe eres]|nr:hypothetical protein LA080_013654 [Diaporthe eres]
MPEPRYLESEHSGQDASERDHPESDCSKSAASKKDGSKSTNGDWPRPCITEIRYKFDKNNRERHVRPLIKFVFPDGETYYEPWNDEKVGCVEVEMDPHMNGVDWASRFPVKFISPTGFLASIKTSLFQSAPFHTRLFKVKLFRTSFFRPSLLQAVLSNSPLARDNISIAAPLAGLSCHRTRNDSWQRPRAHSNSKERSRSKCPLSSRQDR